MRMMRIAFVPLLFCVLVVGWAWFVAGHIASTLPRLIDVEGQQIRMLVAGQRGPVVVLDTFGAASSDVWGTIQWRCARFGRVLSYDHGGTGGSDPGPRPRDARQIAMELHRALRAAGLEPPYLLVGYSFGGPYSRVFADLFPNEVSGLVLVDPSQEEMFDWLKRHRPDLNRISAEERAEQSEFGCTYRSLDQARQARLPAIPVTLITAMKPFGERDRRLRPQWLASHQRWLKQIPDARHIVTYQSDHGIIWEEPDLIVDTIRDMVDRVSRLSLHSQTHGDH